MTKHKFTQKFTIGGKFANGTIGFVLRNQESLPESSPLFLRTKKEQIREAQKEAEWLIIKQPIVSSSPYRKA